MREDLAREFPEAGRASMWMRARLSGRRPVFWDEPIAWAAVSGIGAGFLVAAMAQAAVSLTSYAFHALGGPLPFTLFSLTTVAATAAATAVALGIGGIVAFALYLAYMAFGVALGIPAVMAFCERSGEVAFFLALRNQCTPLGFVTSLWPQLVGIGLGVALSRAIAPRGAGINSLLRIAGGYAIAQFVMSQVWSATVAQTATPLTSGLTFAAGLAAAAVAAGVLAAQLPRGVRNAGIVGGIWLVPWLTLQIPLGLQSLEPTLPAEFVGPIVLTMAMPPIAVACLMLSAAITSRARFIPRDAA